MQTIKNWVFTLNNYTPYHEHKLQEYDFNYLIYGHEIAPTTGTPHLQGYFQLKTKKRLTTLKKELINTMHLEPAYGSYDSNRVYCQKDNNTFEKGTPIINGSNLAGLYDQIIKSEKWTDVLKLDGIKSHLNYAKEVWNNKPIPRLPKIKPRPWQSTILRLLKQAPDDRTIHWVYDKEGGKGKTYLCKYLVANKNAFYSSPSKGQDILYAYNNQDIILYDIPRCCEEEYINWGTIEKLKDGIYFSGKFNSTTKYRQTNAHIIVFSNSPPPEDKFSLDRINLITL